MGPSPPAAARDLIIRRVRRNGQVDELGWWRPESRVLELVQPGFPLTGPGRHVIEGDLPWVFDEMAPDGFLATRFGRWFPELNLPAARNLWSSRNVTDALSLRGHDLAGNLLFGDQSFETYRRVFGPGKAPGPPREHAGSYYERFVEEVLTSSVQSSVGGARPKFALRLADGAGLIVKFTPPLSTSAGRRWADLLQVEAHAAAVLRAGGLEAVEARYLEQGDRGFLEVARFDRLAGGGRAGHVTLFHLGAALYSEIASPAVIVAGLVRDGLLGAADEARFQRVHAFSAAIGNTDAHAGNYGLLVDDDGAARLSPAYDVLPMAFAPRHDELPDRFVARFPPATDPQVADRVGELRARVEGDPGISDSFRARWLESVGPGPRS